MNQTLVNECMDKIRSETNATGLLIFSYNRINGNLGLINRNFETGMYDRVIDELKTHNTDQVSGQKTKTKNKKVERDQGSEQ